MTELGTLKLDRNEWKKYWVKSQKIGRGTLKVTHFV